MNINKLKNKYERLEDMNDHSGAAMVLVKNFGTKEEVRQMQIIIANHERRGYILPEESGERYELSQKYYKNLTAARR